MSLSYEAVSATCFLDDGEGSGHNLSADACLALSLLSTWAPPPVGPNRSFRKDKRWVWAGLGLRMAEELATSASTEPLHRVFESQGAHPVDDSFGLDYVLDICRTIDRAWSILRPANSALLRSKASSISDDSIDTPPAVLLSQALEGLRSTTTLAALNKSHLDLDDRKNAIQRGKALESHMVNLMTGCLNEVARLRAARNGAYANLVKLFQRCTAALDALEGEAKSLTIAKDDHAGSGE